MTTLPHQPDDLDRLLGRYFKAQMPATWPQSPLAAEPSSAVANARGHSARARLTLAASVAVLLGLGVAVSYGPATSHSAPAGNGELMKGAAANGSDIKHRLDAATTRKMPTP